MTEEKETIDCNSIVSCMNLPEYCQKCRNNKELKNKDLPNYYKYKPLFEVWN